MFWIYDQKSTLVANNGKYYNEKEKAEGKSFFTGVGVFVGIMVAVFNFIPKDFFDKKIETPNSPTKPFKIGQNTISLDQI